MEIKTVGVISTPHHRLPEDSAGIPELIEKTFPKVLYDPVTAKRWGKKGTSISAMHVDMAVVFGGDGTLLYAVDELRHLNPLFLGVKTGNVGHLIETDPEKFSEAVESVVKGFYTVDERVKVLINNKHEALNEFVAIPGMPTELAEFKVHIADDPPITFRADGLLVSTPTGSTGYALSVGGPILHPQTEALIVAPINPFRRSQPPLVVPQTATIKIDVKKREKRIYFLADGRSIDQTHEEASIAITLAKNKARFIRLAE